MDKDFLRLMENVDELISRPTDKLEDETLICECFCVNAGDIRNVCTSSVNLDQLSDRFNMGQGCQSCIKNKENWINKIF